MPDKICHSPSLCTGCRACSGVCPKQCITMKQNGEGFFYPEIAQSECIQCHLCEKVCPVNHPPVSYQPLEGYAVRYHKESVLKDSTSGGSFTAIAEYVFSKDGIVYGVGYDKNMKVTHFSIDASQAKRIQEMRGSKYVQSDLGYCFREIEIYLKNGRYVCFSGTPCQVAGLRAFLRKEYDNLLTVDLVCHGVASPLVFREYIKYQKQKYHADIKAVKFRNKTYGYHSGTMMIEFSNGKRYYGSARTDYMLKSYFRGACSRYSCYQCPYKGMQRYGDFTIFDSWHINELTGKALEDDKGFTNIFVNTPKGQEVLKNLKSLQKYKADTEQMRRKDGKMIDHFPKMASCRPEFVYGVAKNGIKSQIASNLKVTIKDYTAERLKGILYKTGVLHLVKKKLHR